MTKNPSKQGEFRVLKATLTAAEFGAVQWAAKRAGKLPDRAVPLADFLRMAVLGAIGNVAIWEIAEKRLVPQEISSVLDW